MVGTFKHLSFLFENIIKHEENGYISHKTILLNKLIFLSVLTSTPLTNHYNSVRTIKN